MMKLESTLFRSNPGSDSLKTTVPRAFALALNLTDKDSLEWSIVPHGGGIVALVKPIKGGHTA